MKKQSCCPQGDEKISYFKYQFWLVLEEDSTPYDAEKVSYCPYCGKELVVEK